MKELPLINWFVWYWKYLTSTWFGLIRLHKYNDEWDKELNELIDKHWDDPETRLHPCTLFIGGKEVWTANAYYGYGHPWRGIERKYGENVCRPKASTMRRLASVVRYIEPNAVVERLKGNG